MRVRRSLLAAAGAATLLLGLPTAASAAPGTATAAMNPCGFYKTASDAYYNHCTGDGSRVVIKVNMAFAPDYERCVAPGKTWLGAAKKVRGAQYVGRTC